MAGKEQNDTTTSGLYSEDLAPVPPAKRTWTTWNYAALWISVAFMFSSCGERVDILADRDLNSGDWLLVRWDVAHRVIHIIDDDSVLSENVGGIRVLWRENHGATTCDGTLRLFKDGIEVASQDYLDASYLAETSAIQKAYQPATEFHLYPKDALDLTRLWDSLKTVPGNYPTIYRTQPEDKDIIWLYRYE